MDTHNTKPSFRSASAFDERVPKVRLRLLGGVAEDDLAPVADQMGVERVRPIRFDPINGILAANDESAGLGENSGEDQATVPKGVAAYLAETPDVCNEYLNAVAAGAAGSHGVPADIPAGVIAEA